MNAQLAQKTLRFVQLSSELSKRALDERNQLTEDREKAAAGRDQLIGSMLEAEAINDNQQTKVAEMLGFHDGTTKLLKSAIARIAELSKTQKQAGELGEGVDPSVVDGSPKEAAVNDNYVGARSSEKRASDRALLEGLGLGG